MSNELRLMCQDFQHPSFLYPLLHVNFPFLVSFDPEDRVDGCPTPPVRGAASSPTEVSYSHPPITPAQGELHNGTEHLR